MPIPTDLIKDVYLSDIHNNDGINVHRDKDKSYIYDGNKNGIIFIPCNKVQTNNTYLIIVLFDGTELTTKHTREVTVE